MCAPNPNPANAMDLYSVPREEDIPPWFNAWHEVDASGQHFYYDPSNNRFGPFPTKLAAWLDCEQNPYD